MEKSMNNKMSNPPVLVPTTAMLQKEKKGTEEGVLQVEVKSINLTKEEYTRPDIWMKRLFRKVENSFITKMEFISMTPPIIRKSGDKVNITAVGVDVSEVVKKEGLCN
tara:strand:- start:62 stop:385 length:324 start_codon:yes stop_codon:yes gene_type:complete